MQALSAQYVPTLYALLFAPSSTNASAWSCNATICAVGLAYGLAFRLLKWSRTTEPRGLLSAKDSLIWHNRVLSSVSAVLLLLVTVSALPETFEESVHDRYYGYSFAQDFAARLFTGFLAFDLAWMIAYQSVVQDNDFVPYLVHHVLFLLVTLYALQGSYFKFHFMWLIASEASNPFINLRWHLAVMGRKDSTLYLVNGAVATLVFFAFRVALWGYMLTVVYAERHIWMSKSAPALFPIVVSAIYIGYGLQVYWFALIVKGLRRAFQREQTEPVEGKKDS